MSFYEDLVMKTQMNYNKYYRLYMMGRTPYELSDKPCAPYKEQIAALIEKINTADCVIVGGASGLSAAGGGDFYYEDSPSFRQYFGKFAKKYGFAGAFNGMQYPYATREEFWAYLATFLYTTQHAPVRQPYKDLDVLIRDKDFHILTTNQDTQFIKLYPEAKVSLLYKLSSGKPPKFIYFMKFKGTIAFSSAPVLAVMIRGMPYSLLKKLSKRQAITFLFPVI